MLITTQTLTAIVKTGQARSEFAAMTMEEPTIAVAISELAGWLRQYSPMLQKAAAIGVKIEVSAELASAMDANSRSEDALKFSHS